MLVIWDAIALIITSFWCLPCTSSAMHYDSMQRIYCLKSVMIFVRIGELVIDWMIRCCWWKGWAFHMNLNINWSYFLWDPSQFFVCCRESIPLVMKCWNERQASKILFCGGIHKMTMSPMDKNISVKKIDPHVHVEWPVWFMGELGDDFIKMLSHQYNNFHHKDKRASWPSNLIMGILSW